MTMPPLSDDVGPLSGGAGSPNVDGSSTVDRRRLIPATDVLLAGPELAAAADRLGRQVVKQAVVAAQDRARRGDIAPEAIAAAAIDALPAHATSLQRVVNATGVIIHTNLGRAPLSAAARDALAVAADATDVEFALATGLRARRGRGALEALAAMVPDAQAVHVVNNNAAALLLCALALSQGREIIISRGELVEIGDGFRIPDLLTLGRSATARGRHHQPVCPASTMPTPSGRRPGSS